MIDTSELAKTLREFAADRDWGPFHTPKNLAMALAGEAGELLEIFQWLTPEESGQVMDKESTARAVEDELADVLIYLVRMADVLGVDLDPALRRKMAENADRYPVERSRASAAKYTEWSSGTDA